MKNFLLPLFLIFSSLSHGIDVKIQDNNLIVNDEPFYMKGICYHPVKKGQTKRNFTNLKEKVMFKDNPTYGTIFPQLRRD